MIEKGVEVVAVKYAGGPHAGSDLCPITKIGKVWPPPEEIPLAGGKYVKVQQSTLPDGSHPNVCRGVTYRWEDGK